jgi:hypothetical protein
MSFPEGWPAGPPQKLIKEGFDYTQPFRPVPVTEMTVWITDGNTEIKREFSGILPDLAHYIPYFNRDWDALIKRSTGLPASRTVEAPEISITIWFDRFGVKLSDETETIDQEAGRLFVKLVFEMWERMARS